ncbi:MAG: iron-containing alcohol dehydrogenase [Lachnospiraceae bacterium]|nr:iron-containing alcohol dehydrogenase [Lachnospiraceae bacterium]
MNNFVQYTPTEVVFGRGAEDQAGAEAKKWGGSKVLLVFGGGSALRSGLIKRVEESLKQEGISCQEFGGVKPNPRLAFAEEGVKKALEMGADLILAVGGGSAIDTAKAIAHGAANPNCALWDIWTQKVPLTKSLPVGAVLTIPAAGSEMSDSAVLTNEAIGKKAGINTPFNRCKFAIMNPELASTLPPYQIACGVTDIMMHTMERYFIPDSSCEMTDEIAEGLLRTVIRNGKKVLENPSDYDAMAEVMWCGSLSHNNLTECGRGKDFSVHKLGHALSARYDVAHGASLAAVWGSWAKYQYEEEDVIWRFARFAQKVWNVEDSNQHKMAVEGIEKTVAFFESLGMPVNLRGLGIEPSDEDLRALAMDATMNDTVKLSRIRGLGAQEVYEIYQMAK